MEVLEDCRLLRVFLELEGSQLLYPLGGPVPADVSREFAGVVQQPHVNRSRVVDVHGRVVRHVTGWDEALDFTTFHLVVHISELHNRRRLSRQSDHQWREDGGVS